MSKGLKQYPAQKEFFLTDDSQSTTTRRRFLTESIKEITFLASSVAVLSLLAACGGGGGGNPVAPGASGPVQIDLSLSQFSGLATVGGILSLDAGAVAGLPSNGLFLVRATATTVVALDRTCTHQGCQVGAIQANGIATCPCHGAQYNTSGAVVRGPASRALNKYTATLEGNIITISF